MYFYARIVINREFNVAGAQIVSLRLRVVLQIITGSFDMALFQCCIPTWPVMVNQKYLLDLYYRIVNKREIEHGLCACTESPSFSGGIIERTCAQTMLYLTCTMISIVDLAHYGVSRAEDWVSGDCGTNSYIHVYGPFFFFLLSFQNLIMSSL